MQAVISADGVQIEVLYVRKCLRKKLESICDDVRSFAKFDQEQWTQVLREAVQRITIRSGCGCVVCRDMLKGW